MSMYIMSLKTVLESTVSTCLGGRELERVQGAKIPLYSILTTERFSPLQTTSIHSNITEQALRACLGARRKDGIAGVKIFLLFKITPC